MTCSSGTRQGTPEPWHWLVSVDLCQLHLTASNQERPGLNTLGGSPRVHDRVQDSLHAFAQRCLYNVIPVSWHV